MKLKILLIATLFMMSGFTISKAGTLTSKYYMPAMSSATPAYSRAVQKTTNTNYNTVYVDTDWGNYTFAYVIVQRFNGEKYVNSSSKTKCTKGISKQINNSSTTTWSVNTWLKLGMWSGYDAMDYDEVTWNYY